MINSFLIGLNSLALPVYLNLLILSNITYANTMMFYNFFPEYATKSNQRKSRFNNADQHIPR